MNARVLPATSALRGQVRVPGDKSISHRAVLFAAMAEGDSVLTGVLESADVRSTIAAVVALGAEAHEVSSESVPGLEVTVHGWGRRGPSAPRQPIDCGNSGTTARLLMGVLAGWDVEVTLTGDESLRSRPMRRVTEPLEEMGASFGSAEGQRLPITVHGGRLAPLRYRLPVASAQVKTAILLAGLQADGVTTVLEPASSRDHTERLLPAFGVPVGRDEEELSCSVFGPQVLSGTRIAVPADPSSAAFVVGAALLVRGSHVTLPGVALNPTRTGFIRALRSMGADIETEVDAREGAEEIGTIAVRGLRGLRAVTIHAAEVPSLVDEVPLLAVVATGATGTTRFEGVGELRVKESDRLAAMAEGLAALGATVRSGEDWLEVDGPVALRGAELDSKGDHRLAMAWAVAGLAADGPVTIRGWEAVAVSYPRFADDMACLGAAITVS